MEQDAERALTILGQEPEARPEPGPYREPPSEEDSAAVDDKVTRCPHCQSDFVLEGFSRVDRILVSLFLLGLPLLWIKDECECKDCGHRWQPSKT